jgi:lysine 2,3-aminomutase
MAQFKWITSQPPESVSPDHWQDWTWQLRNSLKTQQDFQRYLTLNESEKQCFAEGKELFNIRTTPYYASLAGAHAEDPIRKILMPKKEELSFEDQQMQDPLAEKKNQVTPRLIHRYSDRVLYLVTDVCSVYCRFCTRKHFTGADQALIKPEDHQQVLSYLKTHPGVREVILSGGDPLTISDSALDRILFDLRQIPSVEIIRVGSRMPVVAPQRVTEDLVRILRKHKPVFMMTHFNHPREITEQAALAVESFVDHGIPVMNQMVLLNGVNNHPAVIQALSRRLLFLRAKPYYMFQCDPSLGTDHLRNSIDQSLEIQKELWGHLSGLAMPNYAVDIPQGGGKTVLTPNFEVAQDRHKNIRTYKGWDGVHADYISPSQEKMKTPLDAEMYFAEWDQLKNAKI